MGWLGKMDGSTREIKAIAYSRNKCIILTISEGSGDLTRGISLCYRISPSLISSSGLLLRFSRPRLGEIPSLGRFRGLR